MVNIGMSVTGINHYQGTYLKILFNNFEDFINTLSIISFIG